VYLAGCWAKAPAHPSEQKQYSTPWCVSRPTLCQGSTAIRQTGSIGSPSRALRYLPDRRIHLDRLSDVAERPTAALAQLHTPKLAGRVSGGRSQQRLPASGSSGHAGGQVDRCPEPVAPALYRWAGVHAHPDQREAVPGSNVVDDAKPEPDRRRGVGGPQHQRVPMLLTSWA
jgi:hypothetical protein